MPQLKPEERLCFWCQHMVFEPGFSWSSWTWESGKQNCTKGHFMEYDDEIDIPSLFPLVQLAKTCPGFKLTEEIEKLP